MPGQEARQMLGGLIGELIDEEMPARQRGAVTFAHRFRHSAGMSNSFAIAPVDP